MAIFAVHYRYAPEKLSVRDEVRPDHRAWLTQGRADGKVLITGPYADGTGALIMIRADTQSDADALMAQDPFQRADAVAETTIKEWTDVSGAFG